MTHRTDEAYDKRARALGGKSSKRDWTWLGEKELLREILVGDVRGALQKYVQEVPDCAHLIPVERLEGMEYAVVTDLSAPRDAMASTEAEMLIAAYDISRLGLSDTLKGLSLNDELSGSSTIAIYQTRHTLKLHLALQRLAMFLGAQTACQFTVMKRDDWVGAGGPDATDQTL